MNDTIATAEKHLYLALLDLSKHYPQVNTWLSQLPQWLANIKDKNRYGNTTFWQSAVDRLPHVDVSTVDLTTSAISINARLTPSQHSQITNLLTSLHPWRKGPFSIGYQPNADNQNAIDSANLAVYVDTEWRSDFKWNRVLPHISPLQNRRVLDVGGGSGYHGWRMAGAGARLVMIIDPSCLFYHQFMAIRHFIGQADDHRTHYIPIALDAVPAQSSLFDTVFSMGVLYHRPAPFEHLRQLKDTLVNGGELVLETLVVEGDETTVLVPQHRYAQMNNVYFLPSVPALTLWLKKAGFTNVRCVDDTITTTNEQRQTQWMTYYSLTDFLDKDDPSKTVEGYPAPRRATFVAKKG